MVLKTYIYKNVYRILYIYIYICMYKAFALPTLIEKEIAHFYFFTFIYN